MPDSRTARKLGPVFAWILQHVSGVAGSMGKRYYQSAFATLLLGTAVAIALLFFLKETGTAAGVSSSSAVQEVYA